MLGQIKVPRAVRDDISMLDRHIRPRIGDMRITEIAKRDVIRLLDEVAAQPDARKGRKSNRKLTHRPNRVFEFVRAIFRWGCWSRSADCRSDIRARVADLKGETPREGSITGRNPQFVGRA